MYLPLERCGPLRPGGSRLTRELLLLGVMMLLGEAPLNINAILH